MWHAGLKECSSLLLFELGNEGKPNQKKNRSTRNKRGEQYLRHSLEIKREREKLLIDDLSGMILSYSAADHIESLSNCTWNWLFLGFGSIGRPIRTNAPTYRNEPTEIIPLVQPVRHMLRSIHEGDLNSTTNCLLQRFIGCAAL